MTEVKFDKAYFDDVLRSGMIVGLQEEVANRVLAQAKATAPVDYGDYKKGLRIRRVEHDHRTTFIVEGTDWKTLLVESKKGTLARALKSVGKGS